MPTPEEIAELRELQARAYGRGGELTAADAARLHELEAARFPRDAGIVEPSAPSTPSAHPSAAAPSDPLVRRASAAPPRTPVTTPVRPDAAAAPPSDTSSPGIAVSEDPGTHRSSPPTMEKGSRAEPEPRPRALLQRFWRPLAAGAAVLLAVGVGAGWLLFGRAPDAGLPLTGEQAERRVQLENEGKFDEGSLRVIGQDEEALAWYGTKNDGKLACVVLDVDVPDAELQSSQSCGVIDEVREHGVGTNLLLGASGASGGPQENLAAQLLFSLEGEPLAVIQRWETDGSDWLDQFEDADRETAERLTAEGYDPYSIVIAGRVGDLPVWAASRPDPDGGPPHSCLLVPAGEGVATGTMECRPEEETVEEGLTAVAQLEDGTVWNLRLEYTKWHQPYLTVARAELVTVSPDGTVEIGEDGQPVETGPDAPQG